MSGARGIWIDDHLGTDASVTGKKLDKDQKLFAVLDAHGTFEEADRIFAAVDAGENPFADAMSIDEVDELFRSHR